MQRFLPYLISLFFAFGQTFSNKTDELHANYSAKCMHLQFESFLHEKTAEIKQLGLDTKSANGWHKATTETEVSTTVGCDGTYIRVFGDQGVAEFTHAFLVMPDGNLLIGGSHGGSSLLMMVTPGGEILWSKTFDFTNGNDFVFEMMLDSDGMLVATGRDELNTTTTTYFFKFNLQTQSIVWQKLFPFSYSRLETILEKAPSDNYFLLGMVDDNNMFMEINRNTGNLVTMKQFDYGQTDFFLTGKVHNGAIYTAGLQRNGGLDAIRASMTKLSLTGTQLWTRFYFNSLNEMARTYFYENLIENDTIVAYARGDLDGDSFTEGEILLMKANINGDFLWAKRYDIPNSNTEFSGSFIPLPDGYILQGNHILNSTGTSEFFMIRVDKKGNLIWAKSIKNIGGDWGKYAAYVDGFIYFSGRTNQLDPAGDIMVGKMSLDGVVVGPGCTEVSDLIVNVNNVTENYDGQHQLSDVNSSYPLSNANETPITVQLDTNYIPGCECTDFSIDTCANGLALHTVPDAVLQSIIAECIGGSPVLTTVICNADSVALPANTPISFYDENPSAAAASLLTTQLTTAPISPGACLEFTISFPVPTNQLIFAVINDNGSTPTPFDLATDFPNTATQECDFTNNLASFTLNYIPPVLNLGPDLTNCLFEVTELDAGPGFASYHWNNGSTSQTLTASQPGTYLVTVTDACGGTQTDEITLSQTLASAMDIGYVSVELCAGESFTFTVSGFDSYQWSPASLVDCPTCPTVTISPNTDTCFIVVGTASNGCLSDDTVCVNIVTDTATTYQNLLVCEGDTTDFFGTMLTEPGIYAHIDTTGNCVKVTNLTLAFFPKTSIEFTTAPACPFLFDGEITATPIGGTPPYSYVWETGTSTTNLLAGLDVGNYSVTVTDANACIEVDSVELTAAMRPTVSSEVQDASCFGVNDGVLTLNADDPNLQFSFKGSTPSHQTVYDSIWPGGDQYFTIDTFGCQWVSFFFVDSPDKIVLSLPNNIEADMCDSVQILVESPTSPLIYTWIPAADLSCTDCPNPVASPFSTTTYYLTVQDSNGCTASDSIHVLVNFEGKAYIPNAFSPNNDGLNDVFYVLSRCVTEVRSFKVFDRWGEKVFEASNIPPNDPLYGWDGKFRGKHMNSDVFVYHVVVVLADGTSKEYKGDVTLLR